MTQIVALAAMFIIGAIDKRTLLIVLFGQGVSISFSVFISSVQFIKLQSN